VDVRQAPAEQLPFPDQVFDVALSQLAVHFMSDPVAGLREMARVTRPDGVVAASVWDHAGQRGPLRDFWAAARAMDPDVDDESERAGTRDGHLAALLDEAGLREIESSSLTVELRHPTFDDWWEPFERGVGPAGAFVARLDPGQRAKLTIDCRRRLSDGPIVISAVAWAARGRP
jgi:SAM-dependent methyltransferase